MTSPAKAIVAHQENPRDSLAAIGQSLAPLTVIDLIHDAHKSGTPPEALEKLYALYERMEDRNAAKEWAACMRAFQDECPNIPKNRKTKEMDKDEGAGFSFSWSDLRQVLKVVRPLLAKHGFSIRWDTEDGQGKVTCICHIKHDNGHVESARATALDAGGPKSTPGHKHTGAWSIARRLSLLSVLALVDAEDDAESTQAASLKPVNASQRDSILSYLAELGVEEGKFMAIFGLAKVKDLPAIKHPDAMRMLDSKKAAAKKVEAKP